jgi:hypothetical protein
MLPVINRIVLIAVLAGIACTAFAQSKNSGPSLNPPGALWESWIRDNNYEIELKDIAATRDGTSICVLIGYRPKRSMSGPQRIRLDSLNANGTLDFSIELESMLLNSASGSRGTRIDAMAISRDRNVYLVSNMDGGTIRLIGISLHARSMVFTRTISFGRSNVEIQGASSAENGGIFIFGTADGGGFIAQFKDDKIMWQRSPGERSSVVLDAVFSDGIFTAVGIKSGEKENLTLWVTNLEGKVLYSHSLRGRLPNLTRGVNGNPVLAYELRDSQKSQISVQSFSTDLGPTWSNTLGPKTALASRPWVVSAGAIGYVAASVIERKLWITRFEIQGATTPLYTSKEIPPEYPMFLNVKLTKGGDDPIVAANVFLVVNGQEQRQGVWLTRLKLN